MINPDKSGKN